MPSRIRIGPEGGPYVIVDENNGVLDITTPNDEVDFGDNDLINAALGGVLDAKGNDITNVDALNSNSVNTESTDSEQYKTNGDEINPWVKVTSVGISEIDGENVIQHSLAETWQEVRLTLIDIVPENGDDEELRLRVNNNDDARYYYRSEDSAIHIENDEDRFVLIDEMVSPTRQIRGRIVFFGADDATARVTASGDLTYNSATADEKLFDWGMHRDVDELNSVELSVGGTDEIGDGELLIERRDAT